MSDKYNERVQALAEELLRTFKGYKQDTPIGTWEWAFYKDEYTGYARIALKHMAAWYQKGCFDMKSVHKMPGELKVLRGVIEKNKREQGLIPNSSHPFESSNFAKFMKGYYGDSAQEGKQNG